MYESDSEEQASPITDQTYVKPLRTEKSLPRNTHPPYMQMIHESIGTLSTHGKAVSRTKIVDNMKEKYGLNDVSNAHLSRALKISLEKDIIENTTGNLQSTVLRNLVTLCFWIRDIKGRLNRFGNVQKILNKFIQKLCNTISISSIERNYSCYVQDRYLIYMIWAIVWISNDDIRYYPGNKGRI